MSLALKIGTLDYLAAQDGLPQIGVSLQFEIHHDRFSEHLFRMEQFRALAKAHQTLMLREAQSDVRLVPTNCSLSFFAHRVLEVPSFNNLAEGAGDVSLVQLCRCAATTARTWSSSTISRSCARTVFALWALMSMFGTHRRGFGGKKRPPSTKRRSMRRGFEVLEGPRWGLCLPPIIRTTLASSAPTRRWVART